MFLNIPNPFIRAVVVLLVGGLCIYILKLVLDFLATLAGFAFLASLSTLIVTIAVVLLIIWVVVTMFNNA